MSYFRYWCKSCGGHVSPKQHLYCQKIGKEDTCYNCLTGKNVVSKKFAKGENK